MEQTGSKLGKEYIKDVYCYPAYLTYMQSTLCKMPCWMKQKLESRLPGEISIISVIQMIPPLWQKVKRNWRASWWKWKRRVKSLLKLNLQKTNILVSCPITSWQIDGEIMEIVRDFILWDSKITADDDCSHVIKRCLLPGRNSTTNLDSILKQRHYFAHKVLSSQSNGFSSSHVWMWQLDHKESWVLKNWCFLTVVL